jgi:hypothetical protein
MLDILRSMIKEEWRIHSCLFGGAMFALFPVILVVLAFFGSLTIPTLNAIIPIRQFLSIIQYAFVLFGLSVGSFGLFGREVMNRRFGHASLLAYSSRTLPMSERKILLNFFVKDVLYYFLLWILPFALGFALAAPLISVGFVYSLSLLLILSLSFLMGLSIAFILSTMYAHSIKILLVFIVAVAALALSVTRYLGISPSSLLMSYSYIPSANQVALSLLIIIITSSLSLAFPKVDYPQRKKLFKNNLKELAKWMRFSNYPTLISKDFLDFNRSEGGVGKIILSFLVPLSIVWVLIFVFLRFIPFLNLFVVFSILLGIISSSFYNWFTEYDAFNFYAFLPIKVSTILKSKVSSYAIINIVSLAVLILVTVWMKQTSYFLPSLLSFLSVSSYTLAVTVYLAGLNPNIMLYNAKIFLQYLLLISPVLLVMIFISLLNPFYLVSSIALIPVSYKIIRISYDKWDRQEQPTF